VATSGDPVLGSFPPNIAQTFLAMVDETRSENGPDGPRFVPAQMIPMTFVPHRIDILRNFLNDGTAPVHSN
jgi:hypothetical protein